MRFEFQSGPRSGKKQQGTGSKIGTSLFFFFFGAMGTLFLVLLTYAAIEALTPHMWDQVPCVIEQSEMNRGENYEFSVRYRYQFEGRSHTGDTYRPGYSGSEDVGDVMALKKKYPEGSSQLCRVNPSRPEESVLLPGSVAMLFFIPIPLIFMAVGFGGIYFTWRSKPEDAATEITITPTGKKTGQQQWVPSLLGGVFLAAGLGMLFFWFFPMLAEALSARNWVEVPCRVISSQVRSHDSDDGTTYSVDILYRYDFGTETYESNRYAFMGGSSSGYRGKAAVVKKYPARSEAICYVNPERPERAVLNREVGLWVWFGLIPLAFAGAGGAMLFYGFGQNKKLNTPAGLSGEVAAAGPCVLKAETSPYGRFFGMVFVAAFWNGIVSVFLWQLIESYRHGDFEWFLALFLTPFVLIGLGFIFGIIYYGLALFNPRVRLALDSHPGRLGTTFQLAWQCRGDVQRLRSYRIDLVGREIVSYTSGSGKNSRTIEKKNTFYRQTLVSSENPDDFRAGNLSGPFSCPGPPTLEGKVSKIQWKIETTGKIGWWPDLSETFLLELKPAKVANP